MEAMDVIFFLAPMEEAMDVMFSLSFHVSSQKSLSLSSQKSLSLSSQKKLQSLFGIGKKRNGIATRSAIAIQNQI